MNMLYDNKSELENGLLIYSKNKLGRNRISFQVVVNTGSCNDPIGKKGLAHLLEHLLFKIEGYTEESLAEFCDFNGMEFNAATGHNEINIMFNLLPEKLDLVLTLLKTILTNTNYTLKDIKDEIKGPIKGEILDDNISPDYIFFNFNHDYLYKGTKYEGKILGSLESLSKISVLDLDDYKQKYFTALNMFFHFEGDFSSIDLAGVVGKYFTDLPCGVKSNNNVYPIRVGEGRVYLEKSVFEDQNMLSFIYHFDTISKPDIFKLKLLRNILAEGFTSLLMNKLRTKEKLIYGCQVEINYKEKDSFLNIIIPNVDAFDSEKIIKFTYEIIDELCAKVLDDIYFEGKKTHLKFLFEEYFDEEYIRISLLFNTVFYRNLEFENFSDILNNVTKNEFLEFVRMIFKNESTLIIGTSKK
jgi:predicted Zn-dependent peptidase